MFYTANAIPIGLNWSGQATFPQSGQWWRRPPYPRKLDVFANGTDVVYQVMEEAGGWQEDTAGEGLLRMGFNSAEHITPFVAIRFRVWTGTALASSGTIDLKLFG